MIVRIETPCGPLWVSGGADAVDGVSWTALHGPDHRGELDWIAEPLLAYFKGCCTCFPGHPFFLGAGVLWGKNHVATRPLTRSEEILKRICEIPFGSTMTYGEIADACGYGRAARGVGSVCRANPLPLLIPCHRVVGRRWLGGYTPFARIKAMLLELEGAHAPACSRHPQG